MDRISDLPLSLDLSAERREEFVCRAYEEHRAAIYRHMVAIGLDVEAGQDLTQETFVALFESLSKGHQIENLRPWLFAVATRIAVRHLEKLRGEALLSVPNMDELMTAAADTFDPEQSTLSMERKRALAVAMQTLSPQQRICLHLRAEGLRYREIADVTSLSIPSVAEFLRRAINRLRSAMDGK
jgi:RNA polymerase sigma-70 factor (ECF subfamily)